MPTQTELRKELTDRILSAFDEGVVPWRQPWAMDKNCGRPTNAVTGKPYNGINILLLTLHNHNYRSDGKFFATYRQWANLGGQVMARPSAVSKGKWGCKIVLYKPISKTKTNSRGEEVEDSFCVMRQFTVFNVEQVEGAHLDHLRAGYCNNTDPEVSIHEADELIANSGMDIMHGGNKAFYDPTIDIIQMPHRNQFDGTAYYETLFHELSHWAETRLNLDRSEDSNSYELLELVAEMTSCFMCSALGIPFNEGLANHASYVGHWAKKLQAAVEIDPGFILKASTLASKVTDYLLTFRTAPADEPAIVV